MKFTIIYDYLMRYRSQILRYRSKIIYDFSGWELDEKKLNIALSKISFL